MTAGQCKAARRKMSNDSRYKYGKKSAETLDRKSSRLMEKQKAIAGRKGSKR